MALVDNLYSSKGDGEMIICMFTAKMSTGTKGTSFFFFFLL